MAQPAETGFTLVELMVAVAIIGILASVALPNFQNYISRSRQTEAKLALASVYTAETSFRSEQNTYTTCLGNAGYTAPLHRNQFYSVGFGATASTCGQTQTEDCHLRDYRSALACTEGAFPTSGFYVGDRSAIGPPITQAGFVGAINTSISQIKFRAAAVGQISTHGANILDVWWIDESKHLVNESPGL